MTSPTSTQRRARQRDCSPRPAPTKSDEDARGGRDRDEVALIALELPDTGVRAGDVCWRTFLSKARSNLRASRDGTTRRGASASLERRAPTSPTAARTIALVFSPPQSRRVIWRGGDGPVPGRRRCVRDRLPRCGCARTTWLSPVDRTCLVGAGVAGARLLARASSGPQGGHLSGGFAGSIRDSDAASRWGTSDLATAVQAAAKSVVRALRVGGLAGLIRMPATSSTRGRTTNAGTRRAARTRSAPQREAFAPQTPP